MAILNLFNPLKWSLSRKFISIVLLILLIPIASIGLLKEIESTLVQNIRANLMLSSQLIANQLSDNALWFSESLLPETKKNSSQDLFVFPLAKKYNLDGYFDDWEEYEIHRQVFGEKDNQFGLLLGSTERHLVLSIAVNDQFIRYPITDPQTNVDHFKIEFKTQQGEHQSLYLAANAAGSFAVKSKKNGRLKIDWRYKAFWIETTDGFNLEILFPSGIKPKAIKVQFNDVDRQSTQAHISSTVNNEFNPIVWPSIHFVRFFEKIELAPSQRIWLLDTEGRVLASTGSLMVDQMTFSSNGFFNWILTSGSSIEIDPRANNLHLDSEDILQALKGISSTRIENIKNTEQSIALATLPINANGKVIGALLLEENVARVQVLQKKTLIRMFFITFVIFVLVIWIIIWYVSRLVGRIKTLNLAIERVVDQDGRMQKPLMLTLKKGDEIDELYQAFDQMGSKLYEYNDHLEKLASRLSHELRTPIAIVRSSLDNLLLNNPNAEDKEIISRALDGNQRLGEIIARMRQASSVKEAMQNAEKIDIDVVDFLSNLIKGYQLSFSEFKFQIHLPQTSHRKIISPDLFAEMMDKLISNAMEFCDKNSPIVTTVLEKNGQLQLSVSNQGPTILDENLTNIFQSLVSIRNSQQSTGKNLGLGLYVVRLIAEFHELKVDAKNLSNNQGVVFNLYW